ncbi:MAG: ABC transporter substrate-binding protein [Treponemataceae bacterium]
MRKITLIFFLILSFVFISAQKQTVIPYQYNMKWLNWAGTDSVSTSQIKLLVDEYNRFAPAGDLVSQVNASKDNIVTQLINASLGKIDVDIAQIQLSTFNFLSTMGVVGSLNPVFSKNFLDKNYFTGGLQVTVNNKENCAIPLSLNPRTLIVNKKILQEAGVDFEIRTINDFAKALEYVKTNHPKNKGKTSSFPILPYALIVNDSLQGAENFMVWLWAHGGHFFDEKRQSQINSPEGIATLNWYKKIYNAQYILPHLTKDESYKLFKDGKVAFIEASFADKDLLGATNNLDIIPIQRPVVSRGKKTFVFTEGDAFIVVRSSKKFLDAAKFVDFITSSDIMIDYFKKTKLLPANKNIFEDAEIKKDLWMYAWKNVLENCKTTETAGLKETYFNSVILQELFAFLKGSKTASTTVTAISNRLQQ